MSIQVMRDRAGAVGSRLGFPLAALAAGAAVGIMTRALGPKYLVVSLTLLFVALGAMVAGNPRRVLLFLCVALIAIDVKTFQDFHRHTGGAPGLVITAQMILLLPLVLIAIWEHVAGTERPRKPLPVGSILIPLLPLVAVLPSLAASHILVLSEYELLRMAAYFILYLFFALTIRADDLPLILAALCVGVLAQVPFAGLQVAFPGQATAVLGQESAGFIEPLSNGGLRRVAGTLEHPNFLGSYLSLMMPILAVTAFASRFPTRLRVLAWFALLASIPLLLLTLSRGSWIGLGGGLLVLLIVLAVRGHISGSQATFGVLGMIAAAGAIVALPPVWDRLMSSNPYNVTFRLELIAVALPMWQAHFWNGVGLNLFVENMKAFDHNLVSLTKAPVHNIYFMWLAETGVIGAAGMAIYVIWLLARSWITTAARNHQLSLLATGFLAGMVALYLGELASFSTRIDVIAQTTALMAGIMVGLSRRGFLRRT